MHDDDDRIDGEFSLFFEWRRLFLDWLFLYVAMTAVVVVTISAVWLFMRGVIRFGEFVFGV